MSLLKLISRFLLQLHSKNHSSHHEGVAARGEEEGGMDLSALEHYLKWQHAHPFSHILNNASVADTIGGRAFKEWATRFGVPLSLPTLPILQIGPIPWNTFPFLTKSAKAFSQSLSKLPPIRPLLLSFGDIPAWHYTHLRSGRGHTYSCPRLLRQN